MKSGENGLIGPGSNDYGRKSKALNEFRKMAESKTGKPIHVKPNFYSYCFEPLKIIAHKYGYNLVIHGSLNRDMDLIACPWQEVVLDFELMIHEFAEYLGGYVMHQAAENKAEFLAKYHRHNRVINMNRIPKKIIRDGYESNSDEQFYLDITIMPLVTF